MLKRLLLVALVLRLAAPAYDDAQARSGQAAGAATAAFDSGRAWEHLRPLVAIGPRPAGSPAIEQTRKYIKDQLNTAGVTVAGQAWEDETPLGKVRMVNLVATIPGARKDRLVIAGHYDTKLFRQFG